MGTVLLSLCLISQDTNTPPVEPPKPPYSEEQIKRTIDRIAYVTDGAVIRFGLKHLEQILSKMDLSSRDDLRAALVAVLVSDIAVNPTISVDLKMIAGKFLGQAKLVDGAAQDLNNLLRSKEPEPAQTALVEYARESKLNPTAVILDTLKELKMFKIISDIAYETADKPLISYLVQTAATEPIIDLLYGLDGLDAANAVIKDYQMRIGVPAAPTNLTVTQTTYHSIQLAWQDNSHGEDGFIIFRALAEGEFVEAGRALSNQVFFREQALVPLATYRYKVAAYNWNKSPLESNEVSITMPAVPDPLPDPAPVVPELPASPAPTLPLLAVTKKMRLKIEDQPHEETFKQFNLQLKDGNSPLNIGFEIAELYKAQLQLPFFDLTTLSTSLILSAVDAVKYRGSYESTNFNYPDGIRRLNASRFNSVATTLEARLLGDLPFEKPQEESTEEKPTEKPTNASSTRLLN